MTQRIHLTKEGSLVITCGATEALFSIRGGGLIRTRNHRSKDWAFSINHNDLIEALIQMAEERGISIGGE
jgi:hypothetical protein